MYFGKIDGFTGLFIPLQCEPIASKDPTSVVNNTKPEISERSSFLHEKIITRLKTAQLPIDKPQPCKKQRSKNALNGQKEENAWRSQSIICL
ncbi:hypothetical protein T4D_8029 [Trichinella pseudospiralis]|uniref:Uncharacterized protein n=1 Tax=Trichinella pseudospiralis TaxID=6337 RepID=A0A0V1FJX5_TRIPS|nr:hypothetical protein T4D_8029 [Trichinella pseudospiralis]